MSDLIQKIKFAPSTTMKTTLLPVQPADCVGLFATHPRCCIGLFAAWSNVCQMLLNQF